MMWNEWASKSCQLVCDHFVGICCFGYRSSYGVCEQSRAFSIDVHATCINHFLYYVVVDTLQQYSASFIEAEHSAQNKANSISFEIETMNGIHVPASPPAQQVNY